MAACNIPDPIVELTPSSSHATEQTTTTSVTSILASTATAIPIPSPTDTRNQSVTIITDDSDSVEPVQIVGTAEITFFLFEDYLVEPFVMLEDQTGLVRRDFEFIIPPANQIVGPLTHTTEHTWEYVIHLPALPPGNLMDIDNNGHEDKGLKVFAVAVQANLKGDPFLASDEFRGWSTVWTSARIDSENKDEINGGSLVVWAPDEHQAFPTDFGTDQLLFSPDDPVGPISAGYTIINLDESPFMFYKEQRPNLTLYEGDVSVNDYSRMNYTDAFQALWSKASVEYPFSDLKSVNWQLLYEEFAPRVYRAQADDNPQAWYLALRDFARSIPDGHVSLSGDDGGLFLRQAGGGIGLGLTELDNGRVIVHYLTEDGSAQEAGIDLGAEILEINGLPIIQAAARVVPWSSPFSTQHVLRLQQYRYLTRGQLGSTVKITWNNPGSTNTRSATLIFRTERASFAATSLYSGLDWDAPPVEFNVLEESGYGYVRIWTLSDDLNLIIRLFERAVNVFRNKQVPGVILDLRHNLGGSPMGTELASYFTEERIEVSRGYYYSEKLGHFDTHGPPDTIEPNRDLQYNGPVVVMVGPACASACEHVAWVFDQLPQVLVVGQYPTNGIMGEVGRGQYELPGELSFQIPTGMELDMEGKIVVEGVGVVPDVDVPINENTVFGGGDPVLDFAIEVLNR